MTERARIRPAEGLKVPVPGRPKKALVSTGESVDLDGYWRRRLAAGEVVRVEDVKPSPKKAPKSEES
jgi:hypothetical protein